MTPEVVQSHFQLSQRFLKCGMPPSTPPSRMGKIEPYMDNTATSLPIADQQGP